MIKISQKSNERTASSFQWNASEKGHYSVHGDVSEVAVSKLVGQPGSSGASPSYGLHCLRSTFSSLPNMFPLKMSQAKHDTKSDASMLQCFRVGRAHGSLPLQHETGLTV